MSRKPYALSLFYIITIYQCFQLISKGLRLISSNAQFVNCHVYNTWF